MCHDGVDEKITPLQLKRAIKGMRLGGVDVDRAIEEFLAGCREKEKLPLKEFAKRFTFKGQRMEPATVDERYANLPSGSIPPGHSSHYLEQYTTCRLLQRQHAPCLFSQPSHSRPPNPHTKSQTVVPATKRMHTHSAALMHGQKTFRRGRH